jgi:hypothetical protein
MWEKTNLKDAFSNHSDRQPFVPFHKHYGYYSRLKGIATPNDTSNKLGTGINLS